MIKTVATTAIYIPSSVVLNVSVAGGPSPTSVEAVTAQLYWEYGRSPSTVKVVSVTSSLIMGLLSASLQAIEYDTMIPFLPLSTGRSHERVTFLTLIITA